MTCPTSGIATKSVPRPSQTRTESIEIASAIGRTLVRDAMWHGDRCNWLGPMSDLFMGRVLEAYGMLGPSLYDGTAGIGLFLGHLATTTEDLATRETARGAIRHALSRIDDVPAQVKFGFQTGDVGIAYAALTVGTLLRDETLRAGGESLLANVLRRPIGEACILDAMLGFAGAIPAILAARRRFGIDVDLDRLTQWGEALVAAADTDRRGVSWDTASEMRRSLDANAPAWMSTGGPRRPNLLGLAHGAGGIGLALLELSVETGETRFRTIAERAFAYEDSWFDAETMRWPDLRHHGDDSCRHTHVAWCHGAVGIGLIRMRAWELTRDPSYRAQALTAMRITADTLSRQLRPDVNVCLCHGIAGNAELFIDESVGFGAPGGRLLDDVHRFAMDTYHLPCRPWCYGESSEARVPLGLMTGLAGTGHFFLRTADPDAVPSVLLLRAERDDDAHGVETPRAQHLSLVGSRR